jgi:hypothetical protein
MVRWDAYLERPTKVHGCPPAPLSWRRIVIARFLGFAPVLAPLLYTDLGVFGLIVAAEPVDVAVAGEGSKQERSAAPSQ